MLKGVCTQGRHLIPSYAKTWPLLHLKGIISPEKLKHMVKTNSYISKQRDQIVTLAHYRLTVTLEVYKSNDHWQ